VKLKLDITIILLQTLVLFGIIYSVRTNTQNIKVLESQLEAVEKTDKLFFEFIRREHFPDLPMMPDSVLKEATK